MKRSKIKFFGIIVLTAITGFTLISWNRIQGTPAAPRPFRDISAAQLVSEINIGWNLGNTLDANPDDGWGNPVSQNSSVSEFETMWNNPVTTEAMITTVKNAGFNAIRIPVTWHKVVDSDYNIRSDWMTRVVEVVNYAVNNNMYIILNTHHDEHIFLLTNAGKEKSLNAFRKIWEQIAGTFRNYDEKLIFEGLNEPRPVRAERCNLNEYYQVFVDTVRAGGGNNDKRILMVNPYGAELTAINSLTIPVDSANTINKIVVSIHLYVPPKFAFNYPGKASWNKNSVLDIWPVTIPVNRVYDKFVHNGIPVIIGEFGSRSEKADAPRAAWAEYFVSYARSRGIPCFLWDDGGWFKFLDRSSNTFYSPAVLSALMNGVSSPMPAVIEPRRPR
jgi:endoglucanase